MGVVRSQNGPLDAASYTGGSNVGGVPGRRLSIRPNKGAVKLRPNANVRLYQSALSYHNSRRSKRSINELASMVPR